MSVICGPMPTCNDEVLVYPIHLPQEERPIGAFMEKQIWGRYKGGTVVALECTAEISYREHSQLMALAATPDAAP